MENRQPPDTEEGHFIREKTKVAAVGPGPEIVVFEKDELSGVE